VGYCRLGSTPYVTQSRGAINALLPGNSTGVSCDAVRGRALRAFGEACGLVLSRAPVRHCAGYKSLPCRGAFGFCGCGAAPAGFPSSGTGFAPINALGCWAKSISGCLFLRRCSFTPWNIAITRWENSNWHYTTGNAHFVSGAHNGAGGAFQCMPIIFFVCIANTQFGDNWWRENGVTIGRYPASLFLTLRS
jgi:hypothetical protein